MKKGPPKESSPKEPSVPVMEIEPSAPIMENGIEVVYKEDTNDMEETAGTIQFLDGPTKTVVFKKTQN